MTPKEKAIELIHKFCSTTEGYYKSKKNLRNAKQCALVAVDEILLTAPMMYMEGFGNLTIREYYKKVKKEIEAL